ncbi:MAG: hypothetical protein D8M62_02670 [Proteobacteria bacterium]|nr:hypothetical protein [Pseudomonadota bacterium]
MPSDPSQSINPLRLARSRERIEGSLQIDSFERLQGILLENEGELKYSLSFDFDESGTCVIECIIDTQLIFECQRCFKPVKVKIHSDSLLGVANDKDEFEALAKEYEPLQLLEETISAQELIEDELLLAIPISPLHAENECIAKNVLDEINADAKPQPFAALAALKKK